MMIWKEYSIYLTRSISVVFLLFLFTLNGVSQDILYRTGFEVPKTSYFELVLQENNPPEFPSPKSVMRRSLIIPGWGQVTNKQAWKVPIVYGLMGGLTYYSIYLTKEYHQYRAAYYNSFPENTDFRFGRTSDDLMGVAPSFLKNQRDFLRNRRDFIYVTIALSYLLNVVDAYVFAHLRSFDVSDDLSVNTLLAPQVIEANGIRMAPLITFKIEIKN